MIAIQLIYWPQHGEHQNVMKLINDKG